MQTQPPPLRVRLKQSRRPILVIAAGIGIFATFSPVSRAQLAAPATAEARPKSEFKWYSYGPIEQRKVDEKAPADLPVGSEVRRISYTGGEGEFWVGAGEELAKPKDDNLIEFYVRKNTPQDRTVTVKVLDSAGRQGFYEIGVPNDWIKVQLRREKPVHTGGGETPRDIAKVEFIMLNRWFKPGEEWSVDVAGFKTSKISPLPFFNPLWMPAQVPPPVPGNRIEVAIHNIWPQGSTYPGLENPAGLPMAEDITAHLRQEYGPLGIEIGYLKGDAGRKFADFLHQKGDVSAVTAHNHAAFEEQENGRSLTEDEKKSLWTRNAAGQIPTEQGIDGTHGEDLTNPRYLKLAQQLYLRSAEAGANVFRPVDYVWPYSTLR